MNHERAGLQSGPCWKIPATYCVGTVLANCGVGIICQCVAIYWVCKGRQQIQQLVGVPSDDDCGAFCTTCCCFPCTACQEARAVNRMWEANGRRPLNSAGMSMAPARAIPARAKVTQAAPFFARLERDTTVLGMLAEGEEIEVLARVVDEDGRIKVQHPRGWTPAYAPDGRQILYPTDERISGAPLNTSNSNPLYGGSQQFPQQPQLQPQFMERNQLSVLDTSARAGAGATPMPDPLSMGMSRPSSSLGSSETASLQEFLAAHQLSQYVEPMKAIGVTEIEHLADMEEADYIEAGMKKMEIRRLVRVLGEVYISLQRSPATQ